ncbi:MAG: LysR family transcriptional regulator [Moraxellaceae bacterium]|nr:LysR family transcriptional regulator [Moraxellaceae bacterium]
MRITLKQMEVFIAVARSGNVTRASETLNITQSATSMSLADFETQLGRKLFDRVGKRLQLNDAGHRLLPRVLEAVSRVAEIEALAGEGSGLIGQLRIGASLTIGNYLLPGLIGSFMRQHPGAHVALDVTNTRHVIQALKDFRIDAGFIEGFCHEPDIDALPWCRDELVIFAARDHALAQAATLTPDDLAGADWILREPGSGTREIFDNAVLGRVPRINLLMEFGHSEAIRRVVETGLGIGCASRRTLEEAFAQGRVVPLNTPFLDLSRDLFLLVHQQKYRTEGLRLFLEHCIANKP